MPATRPEFWKAKFAANVERDRRLQAELARLGWRTAIIWECSLRSEQSTAATARMLGDWLRSGATALESEPAEA